MTPNTAATKITKTTDTAYVEHLLRQAAFVLKMTRRVKAEIIRDAAGLKTEAQKTDRTATALGV